MTEMKNKTRFAFTVIVISLLIAAPVAVSQGNHDAEVSGSRENSTHHERNVLFENDYEERGPIFINGNDDFAAQAEVEGWPGDGTEGNPYVIEGYKIDGGEEHSIRVINTDYHLIIRGNLITGGESGIWAGNLTNGHIINNSVIGARWGIRSRVTFNITIENNYVSSCQQWGSEISGSIGTIFRNNTLLNNSAGVYASSTINNLIVGNIVNNRVTGIKLHQTDNSLVMGNRLYGHEYCGIEFYRARSNTVKNNTIFGNDIFGLTVGVEPGGGSSSWNNVIYNNDFIENGQHVDNRGMNYYYNESESLGNYWSDYEEKYPDAQEINGIWDTPYEGDETVPFVDEYPQVHPRVPYIRIVHPEDGAVIDEPELTVSWTGRYRYLEELEYEVRLGHGPWYHVGGDTEYQLTFSNPGEYRVEVRATNAISEPTVGGIVDFTVDIEADINVKEFSVSPSEGTEPLEVSITALLENVGDADGNITLYIGTEAFRTWTVTVGETVQVNESYLFDVPGTYTIELGGSSAVITVTARVPDIRVNNFSVVPSIGVVPLEVNITALLENVGDADGNITLYIDTEAFRTWTVTVGETVQVNESYVFDVPGTYTIELGGSSADITVATGVPDIRVNNFSVVPSIGVVPLEVNISALLKNAGDADGNITLYIDTEAFRTWTIAPGETVYLEESYIFNEGGSYSIVLGDENMLVVVDEKPDDTGINTTLLLVIVFAIILVVSVLIISYYIRTKREDRI